MGPPRTRNRAQRLAAQEQQQAARSRFQEGSMSDRVSAAPPVAFLFGPGEREALERPVFSFAAAAPTAGTPGAGGVDDARQSGEETSQRRYETRQQQQQQQTQQRRQQQQPPPQQQQQPGRRKALLGQMWEGVRGRLRLRRDAPSTDDSAATASKKRRGGDSKDDRIAVNANLSNGSGNKADAMLPPGFGGLSDRPTREEVYANYHQLVASGFFSSHAIHSTRQPATSRPATSHDARSPNHVRHDPPQWPLTAVVAHAAGLVPLTPRGPSPICSPASAASSRGTKRAADDDDDDDVGVGVVNGRGAAAGGGRGDGDHPMTGAGDDGEDVAQLAAEEDASTLAHRFLPKRLRKSASRDISLPKLRAVTTRRGLAGGRRSISMIAEVGRGSSNNIINGGQKEPLGNGSGIGNGSHNSGGNKLTKRVPGSSFPNANFLAVPSAVDPAGHSARASLDVQAPPSGSSTGTGTGTDEAAAAPPPFRVAQRQTQSLRGRNAGDDRMPGAFFAGGSMPTATATTTTTVTNAARRQMSSRSLRSKASMATDFSGSAATALSTATTAAEPLSVVPDANRGIPNVPAIPAKFTYGEDRENGVPWRGLRR
ncbi:hypothetical protein O9K51_07434 [Purpureocillium lavendulum]|uniref:Uncharacterized protein n=1 Tax=Purpureocillium lavendulum TaxID=1247861 RepID=A0AB34FMA9_9HYPO|nr:hypothetical protein O9K51_07434 [Purpureocillium lavendulum]